jgi:hypothetical protein
MSEAQNDVLQFSERITAFPVVHGSGDMAQEVRRFLLGHSFDCLAVPLPPAFRQPVLEAVDRLPQVSIVAQVAADGDSASYVPIDPCQPVIAALRIAVQERLPCAFVDLEVARYEPHSLPSPDPYALKQVDAVRFASAMLPFSPPPEEGSQQQQRVRRMAFELHRLELEFDRILFVPDVQEWPWIRQAYAARAPYSEHQASWQRPAIWDVAPEHLYFVLGELPFLTGLYERNRRQMRSDEHLSVDGIKELLLATRQAWKQDRTWGADWVTPQLLRTYLQYVRNLTLMDGRLTPDLYALVVAAKQVVGDSFAIALAETARQYPYQEKSSGFGQARMGMEEGALGDGAEMPMDSRLPGPPRVWRSLSLKPQPKPDKRKHWAQRWNPFTQCSWPPEDDRIESFHAHVREQARALLAEDLARSEKFTSSVKDGIDIRETLRNWHTGDLYVREVPPSRGSVEVVIFLFEDAEDSVRYSWQCTWYAEHEAESTLCFYATPFTDNLVGPGVALSRYGGLFLLFPPRPIVDVWSDPRLDFARRPMDRLVAGALLHSAERHVVLVSPRPPQPNMRMLARRLHRRIIHIPLHRFSGRMLDRIRHFHVLNDRDVRSVAAPFIREF